MLWMLIAFASDWRGTGPSRILLWLRVNQRNPKRNPHVDSCSWAPLLQLQQECHWSSKCIWTFTGTKHDMLSGGSGKTSGGKKRTGSYRENWASGWEEEKNSKNRDAEIIDRETDTDMWKKKKVSASLSFALIFLSLLSLALRWPADPSSFEAMVIWTLRVHLELRVS